MHTRVVSAAGPACGSPPCKHIGHIHIGTHNHPCKACGRQWVLRTSNVWLLPRALVEPWLRPPAGGTKDAPGTDKHKVLEDVLRF